MSQSRDNKEELVQCPALLRKSQKDDLDRLWKETRIPRNELMREAVDDLLQKYAEKSLEESS